MRLIDADKLLPKLWVCYEENKPIVDAEPTVEAVPIEWIKKYMDKVDIEDCGMVYLSPSGPFRDMLKEWEKENERTKI